MSRRTALVAALVALVALAALAGCGGPRPSGTVVPPAVLATSPQGHPAGASGSPTPHRVAPPEVVAHGADGRLLSIVIRNRDGRTIVAARTRITLFDRHGAMIRSTLGPRRSTCCTVYGLSPGHRYGLFLNLTGPADRIGRVEVQFVHPRTRPWRHDRSPHLTVSAPVLTRTPTDAVVTATLTAHGRLRPYVVGQAFLVGPRGRLRAVISGRFYCFGDHTSRRLRMQLLHPVPPGTRIGAVHGFPIPAGAPTLSAGSCTGSPGPAPHH